MPSCVIYFENWNTNFIQLLICNLTQSPLTKLAS